ncbi:DUF1775 domain-containing protein [Pararhizobium gei]|uniref:DUF1775 domain-containing protein n=1 Tax=Pararhizobium gei TaxID=1395951 RepID=UPI0023DA55F0|nr:DUF1775 domain-containing protein [Rhizobium gei]
MQTRTTIFTTVLVSLAAAGGAQAHSSFEIDRTQNDRSFKAILQIPHGCDGKATTEVRLKLPEGFVFAKPQPKAGWELEIIEGDYARSYDNHGKAVRSGLVEIRWKNGNLPDAYYDTFVVVGKFSGFDKEAAVAFPVTQLCGETEVAWDQIAAAGEDAHALEHPAPTVTVTPAAMQAGHGEHAGTAARSADAASVKAGSLEISGGTVKAMLPGAKVGGGSFSVKNGGNVNDRLVSAESPAAGRVELHEMSMQNDIMKMRKIEDGIAVPAGETFDLTGGGLHLMFIDVKKSFAEGDTVPVILTFEKAGRVEYALPVGNAVGGAHSHK